MEKYNDLFTAINAIGEKLAFTRDLRSTTLDIFKDQIDSLIPPTWKQIMTGIQEPLFLATSKYSTWPDKNPEPGINCLASNVRVLQSVTSSRENDQMTMMN